MKSGIYKSPQPNIILNGERLNDFLPMLGNKARMSAFTIHICHYTGSSVQHDRARNRNKKQMMGTKVSLFLDDRIFYIENPNKSTKKILVLEILEKLQEK